MVYDIRKQTEIVNLPREDTLCYFVQYTLSSSLNHDLFLLPLCRM
jgi:hypothetical protein